MIYSNTIQIHQYSLWEKGISSQVTSCSQTLFLCFLFFFQSFHAEQTPQKTKWYLTSIILCCTQKNMDLLASSPLHQHPSLFDRAAQVYSWEGKLGLIQSASLLCWPAVDRKSGQSLCPEVTASLRELKSYSSVRPQPKSHPLHWPLWQRCAYKLFLYCSFIIAITVNLLWVLLDYFSTVPLQNNGCELHGPLKLQLRRSSNLSLAFSYKYVWQDYSQLKQKWVIIVHSIININQQWNLSAFWEQTLWMWGFYSHFQLFISSSTSSWWEAENDWLLSHI